MIIPLSSAIANSKCLSSEWSSAYKTAMDYTQMLSEKYDGEWFKVTPIALNSEETSFRYVASDASGLQFDPVLDNYTYIKYKKSLEKWMTRLYKRNSDCSDILKAYTYDSTLDASNEAFYEHRLSLRSMKEAMRQYYWYTVSFTAEDYSTRVLSDEIQRLFRCLSAETGFKCISITIYYQNKRMCFLSNMTKNYIDSVLEEVIS